MGTNNPYIDLILLIREQGSKFSTPSIQLAEVVSPPPKLVIEFNEIRVQKENILIADYLLNDYKREYLAKGTISLEKEKEGKLGFEAKDCGKTTRVTPECRFLGDGSLSVRGHEHDIASLVVKDAKIFSLESEISIESKKDKFLTFTDTLKEGDLLAIMQTKDLQTVIILARVVKL